MIRDSLVWRFWIKFERPKIGCWNWKAGLDSCGYGSINKGLWKSGNVRASRIAWMFWYGPIPKGMCVLHHCDNRKCVNPEHLYLGTPADNARDRVTRNREPDRTGINNGRAKLTEEQIRIIRQKYTGKYGELTKFAKKYGVSATSILYAIQGKTWKKVF